ncbi:hypothetical protein HPB49_010906 [Dermacentor silvarum]|uniref:Uncharacterized protein n=1 Tax=Dermacentor silvarum TaxID=543639 RepID=A0ACB8CEP5_DERSI|nr:hypothetical protein HPB49_010906 [Dermacentor silvarum]
MWWPSAAFRLIRPPVLVFPPSVAAQGAVGALTNSVRPTAPLPVASWIALGPACCTPTPWLPTQTCCWTPASCHCPCNKRRPGSPMVCDLADPSSGARPKRRYPEQPPAEVMMDVTDAVISDDQVGSGVDPASTPAAERGYDPVLAASNVKQRIRKSRYWVPTDLGQLHGGSGTSSSRKDLVFTVLSYNVLAQGLLEDNPYLYQHCHEEVLQWPLRRQNLLAELREANADILCLQELQQDHYELDFKPELEKMGYGCLYKQRTGDKRDGCGIFFRKSVFELDRFEPIEYSRSDVTVLDRDNVALIAMLKPVAGAAKFGKDFRLCVSTTHLLFNPRRGDIKLAQLCLLLAEIDRLAFCGDSPDGVPLYFPILLCGDMNSEPHSPLYTFLTRGSLCYEGLLSGDVSGQSDGANRGSDSLKKDSPSNSATNSPAKGSQAKSPATKDAAPATKASDANGSTPAKEGCNSSQLRIVRHFLNLISAYKHNVKGANAE